MVRLRGRAESVAGQLQGVPGRCQGAPDSLIIRALEDAVNDGMDVINLSLGSFPRHGPRDDSLVLRVENAVAAGKVVVIAAGNDGAVPNTICRQATAPSAISVGSTWNDRIFAGRVLVDGHDPFAAIAGRWTNSSTPITGQLRTLPRWIRPRLACNPFPAGSLVRQYRADPARHVQFQCEACKCA